MGKCIAVLVVGDSVHTGDGARVRLGWRPTLSPSPLHHHDAHGCRRVYGAGSCSHSRHSARRGDPRHRQYAWVILAGAGGVVFPLNSFPDWYAGIVAWSPRRLWATSCAATSFSISGSPTRTGSSLWTVVIGLLPAFRVVRLEAAQIQTTQEQTVQEQTVASSNRRL